MRTIEVLCVDDEQDFLKLERLFLEKAGGIQVDLASSVPEALERIKSRRYQVVISDYRMRGPSGIDLLKFMRSSGDDTPFIMLTGRGEDETAIEVLSEGATFYVEKGGDPTPVFRELANMVRLVAGYTEARTVIADAEERFRTLGEATSSMVMMIGEDGSVVDCCERVGKVLGYAKDEIVGKRFEVLISGYGKDAAMALLSSITADSSAKRVRIRKKDGEAIPVTVTSTSLRSPDGSNLSGSLYVIKDISKELELERQLVDARRRNENLEEVLGDIYGKSDPELKYTDLKKAS